MYKLRLLYMNTFPHIFPYKHSGAGSEHPDPEVEQRRRKERAEQGVAPDSGNVGGSDLHLK